MQEGGPQKRSPQERSQDRGKATREAILRSASALIARRGFAGAALGDVLAMADVSKGAFFHHFRGKNALAVAAVELYAREWEERFAEWEGEARAQSGDALARLLFFLEKLERRLDGGRTPPEGSMLTALAREGAGVEEAVAAAFERWLVRFEAQFAAVLENRPPKAKVSARALAESLLSLIEGGLVLAGALSDPKWAQREIAGFRRHLALLF